MIGDHEEMIAPSPGSSCERKAGCGSGGGGCDCSFPVRVDPTLSDANRVSLGSGINGDVYALAVSGGTLYAGEFFLKASGSPDNDRPAAARTTTSPVERDQLV